MRDDHGDDEQAAHRRRALLDVVALGSLLRGSACRTRAAWSRRMYGDIRITTSAKASRRPWISSTWARLSVIERRLRPSSLRRPSTSRSSPIPRDALTSTTSPSRSRGTSASRAPSMSVARRTRAASMPAASAPSTIPSAPDPMTISMSTVRAAASPTTRCPSSLRLAELEHLAEDRDPAAGQARQQLQRRDDGAWRGVVANRRRSSRARDERAGPDAARPSRRPARTRSRRTTAPRCDRRSRPPARCGPTGARGSGSPSGGGSPRRGARSASPSRPFETTASAPTSASSANP